MTYDPKQMEKDALKIIKEKNIVFIEDLCSYTKFCKTTFYEYKLNEMNTIKEAILDNVVNIKQSMRAKWYNSDNATLQLALYKLIGSDSEAHRLNGSRQAIDHTTQGEKLPDTVRVEIIDNNKDD